MGSVSHTVPAKSPYRTEATSPPGAENTYQFEAVDLVFVMLDLAASSGSD